MKKCNACDKYFDGRHKPHTEYCPTCEKIIDRALMIKNMPFKGRISGTSGKRSVQLLAEKERMVEMNKEDIKEISKGTVKGDLAVAVVSVRDLICNLLDNNDWCNARCAGDALEKLLRIERSKKVVPTGIPIKSAEEAMGYGEKAPI